jgi:hypothetical protein
MVLVTHNKQTRSAIIGMVLGDAHIRKHGSLAITHCLRQKSYLEMKRQILERKQLAIWYQDDGSLTAKKRGGKIHAYDLTLNTYLSKSQNEIIISYFKEAWSINWGLSKSKGKYRLRMGTKEARKFIKLIEPYIVPDMRYKIEPLV